MVSGFVSGSGWEGPAWSALSLVLDFAPVSSPVNFFCIFNWNEVNWMFWSNWESSESLHLLLGSIGELVDGEGGKWVLSVELSYGLEVVFEHWQSVAVLVAVAVSDSVGVKEVSELSLDAWRWSWWEAEECNSCDSDQCYDSNCLGVINKIKIKVYLLYFNCIYFKIHSYLFILIITPEFKYIIYFKSIILKLHNPLYK